MTVRALSLFSGGGGGDVGLHRAGIDTVAFSEIDPYACAVLRSQWPLVPNLGDIEAISGGRKMKRWMQAQYDGVDLIHSSSPCQDLSVAGKRSGITGLRSSLFFRSVRIWKILPNVKHFLWENVPGALSSNKGQDFALVLSAMVGGSVPVPPKGRWANSGLVAGPTGVAAWRILDLQYFGPAQRRRRLFVFAARDGGVDPAEVLLECEELRWDTRPRSIAWEATARRVRGRTDARSSAREPATGTIDAFGFNWQNGGGYKDSNDGLAITPNATGPLDKSTIKAVVAFDPTQVTNPDNRSNPQPGDPSHPLAVKQAPPVVIGTLNGHQRQQVDGAMVADDMSGLPRRLMPIECERLMGWEDNYTAQGIFWTKRWGWKTKKLSDAARYRICGNGIGAPQMHWIGLRFVNALNREG